MVCTAPGVRGALLRFVGLLAMRTVILALWVQVPLWWCYATLYLLHRLALVPALVPAPVAQLLSAHPWPALVLFLYSCAENLFSLYYQYLCHLIQRPGPRPIYGRRFLRYVLSRALDSGSSSAPSASSASHAVVASAVSPATRHRLDPHALEPIEVLQPTPHPSPSASPAPPHAPGKDELERDGRVRRLRRVSYVPAFVDDRLTATDPRAQSFAQGQGMWYWSPPANNLTRRDVEHWLAWALYGQSLAEIEEEAKDPRTSARTTTSSPAPPSWSDSQGRRPGLIDVIPRPRDMRQWDHVETRARPGEWNDPIQGNRLDFLHYCRELIEARQGFTLPLHIEGRDKKWLMNDPKTGEQMHRVMRLTVDPVRTCARPLLLYLVTNTLCYLERAWVCRHGFREERIGRLRYLIYRPPGWTQKKAAADESSATRPLVFFHGLGIGLAQYDTVLQFLVHSPEFHNRPILVPIQGQISMAIFTSDYLKPFEHHEMTEYLDHICRREGWLDHRIGIEILGHSWGTIVASWTLKSMNTLVKRCCLVDPVCFQLWVPHVCFNFVYRHARDPVALMMRYFVAREVGTANVLCRYFDWSSNILWPEEIPGLEDPNRVLIMLATQDAIIDWKSNLDYLTEAGMRNFNAGGGLFVGQGLAHGELLLPHGQGLKLIRQFFTQSSKAQ